MTAADPTAAFFDRLAAEAHVPSLAKATGTLRFDVKDGARMTRWLVAVAKGDVTVSRANRAADCVVRINKSVMDGLAGGEVNALAAVLRGTIEAEGDVELLVLFQRLLPGPRGARGRVAPTAAARR
jgi:ubiquinone biosynthesis protein UbiJ